MSGGGLTVDRRETLALAAGAALMPLIMESKAMAASVPEGAIKVGRDQPFNDGWRFYRGTGEGLEATALDDAGWRSVDLPHDWSIEDVPGGKAPDQLGPFSKTSQGKTATGFTEGGEGWYRKHFRVDGAPADARVEVLFDGIYLDSEVWLNGRKLGGNVYGYNAFAFDLTPYLARGGDNALAVRVRNVGRNSRWYGGSGIYREARIDVLPPAARLARWGVGAWTRRIAESRAEIDVTTRIEEADPALSLVTRLRDGNGKAVAEARASAAGDVKQTLSVPAPRLWSPDSPELYTLETELRRGETVVDRIGQPFGIRIVAFDPRLGMTINGARTILRGGCVHHDNGLLGARAFRDADERRIRLLKARGFNAIRSSHNIASRSLRETCDRLGTLLIDEAFDAWHQPKEPDDFSVHFRDHWEEVVRAMVLSARNSPSVVMWSIGNEIPQRASDEGVEWSWKLANAVRSIDPTRPVTAGLNGLLGAPMVAKEGTARQGRGGKADNASSIFLDVSGYNYRLEDIEADFAEHPERIVYGSETFPKEAYDYRMLAERAPYMLGEFVWTAMDYLGEAGIGASANVSAGGVAYYLPGWPWVNAWCGDIDLIGDQKAPSRYRDVVWGLSQLEVAVQRPVAEGQIEYISQWGWSDELPSWTWGGADGKPLAVRLYSPGDRVELLLNGAKVGEQALTPANKMRAEIKVPYAPGILEAVAYAGGKVIGRKRLETVDPAAQLRLRPESLRAGGGRQNLAYVAVDVLDAKGRLLPDEVRTVSLAIEGPAELAGFGSGNPHAVGSFQAPEAKTFRGRALAILRGRGKSGDVRITARSEGLKSASVAIKLV